MNKTKRRISSKFTTVIKASKEPTDKSIPAAAMTNVIPTAKIMQYEA